MLEQSHSLRHCSYCNEDKVWQESGKKLKDGTRIYVNKEGRRWAGKRCPDCEKLRVFRAIRCDKFERQIIMKQLETHGYEVLSTTIPMTVQKDGRQFSVGVQRAFAQNQKIVLETHDDHHHDDVDLVAILFESVRLCSPAQLKAIANPEPDDMEKSETTKDRTESAETTQVSASTSYHRTPTTTPPSNL